MRNLPLANRKPEVELFSKMLARHTAARILLVEAQSGVGKSDLLAQFKRECSGKAHVAMVDLKAAERGVAYFFWRAREELGHAHFQNLAAATHRILFGPNVTIEKNWILGKQEIEIALHGDDKTRAFLLDALHEAFFQDLRAIDEKLVLIIDTYNAAGAELGKWIGGEFLAAVVHSPNLLVVIAGQNVPTPSVEWMDEFEHRKLEGIRDAEAWHECAQRAGIAFERRDIETLCWLFDGHPAGMTTALKKRAAELGL
ncbi:MAG: ATP-binding protein [Chloroflexi bacterium]|nr:ATP-binding protein [Chloroflexota bacterium]